MMLSLTHEPLGVGRVDDELVVDNADADGADGAVEWDVRERERAAGTVDAEDVRVILLVGRVDEGDDLGLVAEALREERADGTVDLAGGQDLLFGGTAFALDEAAGDASTGVRKLSVFNGQREEVKAFLWLRRGDRGCENGVVAAGCEGGTGGLLGQPACLKFDLLATCKLYGYVLLHDLSSSFLLSDINLCSPSGSCA